MHVNEFVSIYPWNMCVVSSGFLKFQWCDGCLGFEEFWEESLRVGCFVGFPELENILFSKQ